MRKRTKIAWLILGALFIESIVMLNVRWCGSTSFLIVNESMDPLIDVALFYEGKKYWQGRLGPWDVEQATVPTWRAGGVDIQVTLANGAKLTHPGTYVDGSGNYQIFKIWSDRIEYHPATGSGYLGLTGYGGFALFLDLADLGVRYMTCPVRWAVTSLLY